MMAMGQDTFIKDLEGAMMVPLTINFNFEDS